MSCSRYRSCVAHGGTSTATVRTPSRRLRGRACSATAGPTTSGQWSTRDVDEVGLGQPELVPHGSQRIAEAGRGGPDHPAGGVHS